MSGPAETSVPEERPVLRARGLRKVYHVAPQLRSLLFGRALSDERAGAVIALDDVGFDLEAGRALAIVGANGAGKSTLLRILAGLSLPSAGSVECHSRIGTLLDLGAGLVDEWSGAVNARSALALQGLPPARLGEIETAADVGEFFARPVRTYSTGMRLRLAYALALGLAPEVLIADEVVAVGDESFQRRCALQLQRFLGEGGTLVLATHNLYLADKLCQQAIWLERGRIRQAGPTREVTAAYRDAAASAARERNGLRDTPERSVIERAGLERESSPAAHDLRATPPPSATTAGAATDAAGSERGASGERVASAAVDLAVDSAEGGGVVTFGSPWSIRVGRPEALSHGSWLDLRRADGTLVARLGVAAATLRFASCSLLPGRFSVELCEPSPGGAALRARATLLVRGARRELGSVVLEHEWL